MKSSGGRLVSRRGLAALIASAPVAAGQVGELQQAPAERPGAAAEALAAHDGNRMRLKSVKLAREVEPAFRFEP